MTTLEPGASVVLTHGLRPSPRSTAFFANSAAPIMTVGLDVLVQDVIAAMATAPWSSSNVLPSDVTRVGRLGRPAEPLAAEFDAGASLAGNDSSEASSAPTASLV